jgi:hypothetical protein
MTQGGRNALEVDGRSARLWRVVVSLATPPENSSGDGNRARESAQISIHAENLAAEFDEAYTEFVDGFDQLPRESQLLALQAVDTKLAAMVRAKDAALWTVQACREDPSWREVRVLAEATIVEFDWPQTLDRV